MGATVPQTNFETLIIDWEQQMNNYWIAVARLWNELNSFIPIPLYHAYTRSTQPFHSEMLLPWCPYYAPVWCPLCPRLCGAQGSAQWGAEAGDRWVRLVGTMPHVELVGTMPYACPTSLYHATGSRRPQTRHRFPRQTRRHSPQTSKQACCFLAGDQGGTSIRDVDKWLLVII